MPQEYLLITRNTPDVSEMMSGYPNANNIYNDKGRRYYIWTNATADDSVNFENLQTQGVIHGFILLPAEETL